MADSSTGGFLTPTSPPPPEDSSFDAIIQALAAGVTGLPGNLVRPRWEAVSSASPVPTAMPEVGVDWCAIGVVDEVPVRGQVISQHQASANGGNGQTVTQTFAIVQVLASFYGPNCRGNASLLRDGLMVGQNREQLQLLSIGLVEMPSAIRFIPEMVNSQFQRRADVSFLLIVPFVRVYAILNLLAAQGTIQTDVGNENVIIITDPMPSP